MKYAFHYSVNFYNLYIKILSVDEQVTKIHKKLFNMTECAIITNNSMTTYCYNDLKTFYN